jgi:GDP-L-fucose synthase
MSTKVLLTGASGFLGRHALPVLQAQFGAENVVGITSTDYDLMQPELVDRALVDHRPEIIVHLAAYSGGIGANRAYPADFYYRNTLLTALMFEAAARHKVHKLVYPMGGCSYPAKATSPISEDQLFNGYPQYESAGYSTAKMMGVVASRSYRTQYNLDSSVIIPGNMYGEYDNYSPLDSHVVPAMIRRYYEAMMDNVDEVMMWGTGKPQRDFVYAGDVAKLIPYFMTEHDGAEPVNISSGTTTAISFLAQEIARLVDYQGKITWDVTKPDGQMVKIFATDRMKSLGLSCDTPLVDGLQRTIDWFAANYATCGDGLRL